MVVPVMRGPATILRSIQIITAGYVSSQIQIHAATIVGPLVFVVTTFFIFLEIVENLGQEFCIQEEGSQFLVSIVFVSVSSRTTSAFL